MSINNLKIIGKGLSKFSHPSEKPFATQYKSFNNQIIDAISQKVLTFKFHNFLNLKLVIFDINNNNTQDLRTMKHMK